MRKLFAVMNQQEMITTAAFPLTSFKHFSIFKLIVLDLWLGSVSLLSSVLLSAKKLKENGTYPAQNRRQTKVND